MLALPLLALFAVQAHATAQPAQDSLRARTGAVRGGPELEAFLDGVMTAQLENRHVAGAVVAIVKDGAVLLTKGYGFADVDRRVPVDAERTLFRPGSVSKLFTWTAVMQLVEHGKLSLDADVNTYIDFKIPATFPAPVTLRHLMTHTAGFEEEPRGLISDDSLSIRPMGEWLPRHMPTRVKPPGLFSSYSNWGTAVAGYAVERVSGVPFADYIQRNILDPLGMAHSTAHQPLPASLAADMSHGYEWSGGRYVARKWEYLPGASPAGMMSASGADMAKFMLAHLANGELNGVRILSDGTARLMHARTFGHDPRIPGFALGFYEKSMNGLRIIGHGGDSQWFHTDLALIPSENLGLYVSYNTDRGGALNGRPFLQAFLDHYYPTPLAVSSSKPTGNLARFAGVYQSNRRSYTKFIKAFDLAGGTEIQAIDSGLVMGSGDELMRLVEIEPLLFRNVAGPELVAFRADSAGRITHAFLEEPMLALEKQPWNQRPSLHLFILTAALVTFLGLVVSAIRSLFRRNRPASVSSLPASGRWLLVGAAVAFLAFAVIGMILAQDFVALIFSDSMTKVRATLALPVLGAVLTLAALVAAIRYWIGNVGTRSDRIRYTGLVLVAVLFVWSLSQWNLLGWKM